MGCWCGAFAAASAYANHQHGTRPGAPGDAWWFFPAMSLAGPALLEVTVRRVRRWVQTTAGRYERPLPHFRLARWLVAPRETARAWRLAVTEGYWRPDDAIAAARTTRPTRTARTGGTSGASGATPPARPVPAASAATAAGDRPPSRTGTPTAPGPDGPGPVRAAGRRSPTGGTAGRSGRRVGVASTPTDQTMRAYWQAERAKGRTPGGAELARAAGLDPVTGAGRKARRRYLTEEPQPDRSSPAPDPSAVPPAVPAGEDQRLFVEVASALWRGHDSDTIRAISTLDEGNWQRFLQALALRRGERPDLATHPEGWGS